MSQAAGHKLVLLGESAVGKSSIVLRITKNTFSDISESTIGAAFVTTTIQTSSGPVKFDLWDTAGQERYSAMTSIFYRNAAAAVVVYDITSAASFQRVKRWVEELRSPSNPTANTLEIVLIGNKIDMDQVPGVLREVTTDEAQTYAKEVNVLFFESSAKLNINIVEAFQALALNMLNKSSSSSNNGKNKRGNNNNNNNIVVIDGNPQQQQSSSGCC